MMNDWVVILLRAILLFFLILVVTGILGKTNVSKVPPYKYVSYSVIAVITALMAVNVISNMYFGLITIGVFALLTLGLDYLIVQSKWVHDQMLGKETILVDKGKLMEQTMTKAKMRGEEFLRELRAKNAFSIADVEFAVLEPTGEINVLLKSDKKPVTPHDMSIAPFPQITPQTVILEGKILNEPLSNTGFTREWLATELNKAELKLSDIFIGQVDTFGELYVDLINDDAKTPQPQVRPMLYANLQKLHADLLSFALETANPDARELYNENAAKLERVINRIKPYLLK